MDLLRAATARAEGVRRLLDALDRAGFREVRAPELDALEGLRRALVDLVPRDAPLPQRLTVLPRPRADAEPDAIALVLHDGRARALESELVALAAESLAGLGASGLALTLRSLEPARALLLAHGLDRAHAERFLEEPDALRAIQGEADAAPPDPALVALEGPDEGVEPERLERVLLGLLGRLRFRTYGTRTPEEVAARLASRLGRTLPGVVRKVRAARAGLQELAALEGGAASLARADEILARAGAPRDALTGIRESVEDLARLGIPPARLELTPGSGREAAAFGATLDPTWTLDALGRGRLAWGGGFELRGLRVGVAAIRLGELASGSGPLTAARTQVLVVPVSPAELGPAHALASEARAKGLRVELDPSGRNLRSALRAASRREIPLVAILGEREVREGTVLVKDLGRGEQRSVARASVVGELLAFFAPGAGARPALAGGGA